LLLQPLDGVAGDVFREVVVVGLLLGNRGRVAGHGGFVLRGFTVEKPAEVFKAAARWPVFKRPHCGQLLFQGVVPLAKSTGVVAAVLENFSQGRRQLGNNPADAIKIIGYRCDLAVADVGLIAPGKQRRSSKNRFRCSKATPRSTT
jgi:hypothetical protein